ncbi:hypothetical protein LWF01_10695 [Saxibacter everestensis]|uniref:PH domain-containing protein n=1 Tax=Saxibacter everestensis TaxID=2909229 RepID=A0ABY8QQC0_9MICO|nr:hypothetical protein LWF01_10695 [Brevibacteriaceae bacterium ZFBP1038]
MSEHEQGPQPRGDLSQSPITVRFDPRAHRRAAKQALVVTLVLAPITIGLVVWMIVDALDHGSDHQLAIILGLPLTVLSTVIAMCAIFAVCYWPAPFVRFGDVFAFDASGFTARNASVPWQELIAIRVVSNDHDHLELHVRDAHALRERLRRRFRVLVEQGPGATGVMRQRLDGIAVRADVEAMLPRVAREAAARGVRFDVARTRR